MGTDPSLTAAADGRPDAPVELSLNEWVVLAVLSEAPSHGFALAKQLRADTDLGRVLTVHRPLVYRALDRLVGAGVAEAQQREPGDAGPNRTRHRITDRGRTALDAWLDRPVGHVRDLRIEFVVKVRLNQRRDREVSALVEAQQAALATTLDHLTATSPGGDVVERWRHHNAVAARAFLTDLGDVADVAAR